MRVLVARSTLHVTRHTSHVTRHTSHVTRHTSHVTRHLQQRQRAECPPFTIRFAACCRITTATYDPETQDYISLLLLLLLLLLLHLIRILSSATRPLADTSG